MDKVRFLIGDSADIGKVRKKDGQFIIAVDDTHLNAYVDYDDDGTVMRKQIGGQVMGVKGDSEAEYHTGNVNITPENIGLGNVGNFKAVSTASEQGLNNEEKSNARANIGAGTSDFSGIYDDLSGKPSIPTAVSELENDAGYLTDVGTRLSTTVNGNVVIFTDPCIKSDSTIDGPYFDNVLVKIASITVGINSMSYLLESNVADGRSAYIWVR